MCMHGNLCAANLILYVSRCPSSIGLKAPTGPSLPGLSLSLSLQQHLSHRTYGGRGRREGKAQSWKAFFSNNYINYINFFLARNTVHVCIHIIMNLANSHFFLVSYIGCSLLQQFNCESSLYLSILK